MNEIVTPRRLLALAAALLLGAGACSGPRQAPGNVAVPTPEKEGGGKEKSGDKKAHKVKGGDHNAPGTEGGGGSGNGGGSKGSSGGGGGAGAAGGSQPSEPDLPYPAAGTYNYEQTGYEEFCQATCDRKDLPAEQPLNVSYKDRSKTEATVVSESRSSNSRVSRTTYKFMPAKALITEVFTQFKYESFQFSDTYHPDPPVEALKFPLREQMDWSGKWKDKTSGDYSISVDNEEAIFVAGRSVRAFEIETVTNFRGQFEGQSTVTIWFDAHTKTVIKSQGELDVKSQFGRYHTEFSTELVSGPGY